MKKRVLSLFVALTMVLSLVPIVSITASAEDEPTYSIKLQSRKARGAWETNHTPFESSKEITFTSKGVRSEKLTIYNEGYGFAPEGEEDLVQLALMSKNSTFCDTSCVDCELNVGGECYNLGGFSKDDVEQLPNSFLEGIITFENIVINDKFSVLARPESMNLLSEGDAVTSDGAFVYAQIWNGWYAGAQKLSGVELIDRGIGAEGISFGVGEPIKKIEVTFSIDIDTPDALEKGKNHTPIVLAAREATDFSTAGNAFWKSNVLKVASNGNYSLTVDTPGGYDRLAGLAIMSENATFHEKFGFIGSATPAPQSFSKAKIDITNIIINETIEIGNTWGTVDPNNFVGQDGNVATDGYVSVNLWNAWDVPSQRLTGVEALPSLAIGNEDFLSFAVQEGLIIENITVEFTISGATTFCLTHKENVRPCTTCTEAGLCPTGCGETVENCNCCKVCNNGLKNGECDCCTVCNSFPCICCEICGGYPDHVDLCDECGECPCICCEECGKAVCECKTLSPTVADAKVVIGSTEIPAKSILFGGNDDEGEMTISTEYFTENNLKALGMTLFSVTPEGKITKRNMTVDGDTMTFNVTAGETFFMQNIQKGNILGKGEASGSSSVEIGDALDILMFLANMDSSSLKGNNVDARALEASLISNPDEDAPSISDALQILMHLANMTASEIVII